MFAKLYEQFENGEVVNQFLVRVFENELIFTMEYKGVVLEHSIEFNDDEAGKNAMYASFDAMNEDKVEIVRQMLESYFQEK